jgi:dipeptidyl aminopeptidase/acylaminoacyl peptidase
MTGPIAQVSASGGAIQTPVPRSAILAAETGMRFPTRTRDGGALLFVPLRPGGGLAAWVANERRELLRAAFQPQITRDGQLLFLRRVNARQVDLCAVAIDQAHASLSGEPVPVLSLDASGGSGYAMAADGTLVYKAAQGGIYQAPHTWVSVGQSSATPPGTPREDVVVGAAARVSPDGQHVVFASGDSARIHVLDLAGGTRSVVVPAGPVWWPIWSHDGRRIIYTAGPAFPGGAGLFWKRIDGSGPAERLTTSPLLQQMAEAVTGDGRFLVYSEIESGTAEASERSRDTRSDLWVLPLTPRGQPRPLVQTKANEGKASISPDGRWLAYTSDETGRSEVWVRPFPDGTVATQASPDGGTEPLWAPDGRTLYYRDSGGMRLLALPVASGPVPQFGVPVARIGHWNPPVPSARLYDITPDGSALLIPPAPTYGRDLGLILHFDEVIRRKLADGRK